MSCWAQNLPLSRSSVLGTYSRIFKYREHGIKKYHRSVTFPSVGIIYLSGLGRGGEGKVYLRWYFVNSLVWETILGFGGNFGCLRLTLAVGGLL